LKFFSLRIAKNDFQEFQQSVKTSIFFFQNNAKADKAQCKTKQSKGTAYEHPFPVQFTHETGCSRREQGETFHLLPIRFLRYSLSGSFDAGPDSQLHFSIDNNENCQRVLKVLQRDGSG
jgi:hypothetical protein